MSPLGTVEEKNNKEYLPEQADNYEKSAGQSKNRTYIYLFDKKDGHKC